MRILLATAFVLATLAAPATASLGTPTPDVDPRTSGKAFGFNTQLGAWGSGVTPAQEAALVKRAGGTMQRLGVSWRWLQRQRNLPPLENAAGVISLDAMVNAAIDEDIRPVLVIIDAPKWAACGLLEIACENAVDNDEKVPPLPSRLADYGAFARALAERYPTAAIEPWNEPNNPAFWAVRPIDAERMAAMQCAAHGWIKDTRPNQTVLAPGLLYLEPADAYGAPYASYLTTMYEWMDSPVCWDALSSHVYTGTSYTGAGNRLQAFYDTTVTLRGTYGDPSPLWVTETGATTTGTDSGSMQAFTPAVQRDIVRGVVNSLLSTPDVGTVLVHTLRDRPIAGVPAGDREYGFGALADGSGPTPPPKLLWCHLVGKVGGTYTGC